MQEMLISSDGFLVRLALGLYPRRYCNERWVSCLVTCRGYPGDAAMTDGLLAV